MPDRYEARRRANGERAAHGPIGPDVWPPTRAARHNSRPWWTPTARSRLVGAVIVTFLLLVLMAVVGAIEGPPASGSERPSLLAAERAVWDSLGPLDRNYYCSLPRRDAVLVWAAGIDESENWDAPEWRKLRVSRLVLSRGCATG